MVDKAVVGSHPVGTVAKSLNEARRKAAEALDAQVKKLVREPAPARVRLLDGRELRGLPAVGPLSAGSAIHGTEPGFGLFDE
jgi:hypothetical protein